MTVQRRLLEVLVCPACKGSLVESHWQGGGAEVPPEKAPLVGLDCRACRLRYPIVDDIPVMLVDQAQRIGL